jgi:hypothetical protein
MMIKLDFRGAQLLDKLRWMRGIQKWPHWHAMP